MSYTRLTHREREEIALGLASGRTSAEIGALLGRSGSTIRRAITRHGGWSAYRPLAAHTAARRQATHAHRRVRLLVAHPALLSLVKSRLRLRWSPRQISQWLRAHHPEQPPICADTVYQYLYALPRGPLKREPVAQVRRPRQQRRPKTRTLDGRGHLPERVSMHARPAEVAARCVPGHWEADLVMGAGNRSAIATRVERSSRLVVLVKPDQKDAASVARALARRLRQLPASLRKPLTYDQGKEMARHADLTLATGIQVCFCDPHSPRQRGSNENTNGLLRDFFPTGTDFATVSAQKLNWVQQALNERPRKTLDWKTPKQVFNQFLSTPIDALAT